MTNTKKINLIRDLMPVTQSMVYFNAGSVGPLSTIAYEALHQTDKLELLEGRATMKYNKVSKQTAAELRHAFAGLVKAGPDEIALTRNATEGMNIAVHGLNWQPGDELITTNLEHPGGLFPPYVLRRRGVIVRVVEIPADLSPGDIVARFEAAITPRTRLMVYSHVAWNTGVRLPMAEIVAMGHRHHVMSAVDAAQSGGAVPLDLPASGVDFYALTAQKWLCGPEGVGAFYVRHDRLSLLEPTFVGYRSMGDEGAYNLTGHFIPASNARRYESATLYRPGIKAMLANLNWLEETVGWDWIYARIAHLAGYARDRLAQLSGLSIITPPGDQAGLLTFNLDGYDPARVMTKLAEDNIVLRFIADPYALRISTGFYNTDAEIDQLVDALQDILAGDPESLPVYET